VFLDAVDVLQAVAVATGVFALLLVATYILFLLKSPPPYRRPEAREVLAILLILAVFFAGTYLLLNDLK
jgi:amino acid transporter